MIEALQVIAVLSSLLFSGVLLVFGLTEFLDPWNKKEKIFGGIKLAIGALILIGPLVLLITTTEEQVAFEMKCLSKGGFPTSSVCYKDGQEIVVDEEGQN